MLCDFYFDNKEKKMFKKGEEWSRAFLVGHLCRHSRLPQSPRFPILSRAGRRGVGRDGTAHSCCEWRPGGAVSPPQTRLVHELRPGSLLGPGLGRNLEGHSQTNWGAHTSQGLLAPENVLAAPRDSESDPFRGSAGLPPQAPTAAGILGEPDEALVSPSQGITPKGDPSAVGSLLRTPPRGALRGSAWARVCESPGVLLSPQVPGGSCT